ncbi:MAG: carboxypeptidase-like regulatory domain-containing protein, partial [Acidobacteriota bacterium]
MTAPGYSSSSASVSLALAQKAQKTLAMVEDGVVSGSVLDEEKHGVAGVVLNERVVSRDPMQMGRSRFRFERPAASTPEGRFVLRTQPDVDVQIDAVKRGMPPARSASLHLAPGERKSGVVLTIVRGVAMAGRVLDKAGKPLSGASVVANPSEGNGGGPAMMMRRTIGGMMRGEQDDAVSTGSDGAFSLRLKEGSYDLVIKHEGYAAKTVRAQQVSASAKPLEVTLEQGAEISGRVTRAGNGIDGVNVSTFSEGEVESAVTGPDGSFRISDLSPGQVMVNFRKPDDFIQQMRSVKAPAQDVNLEVPPGGRISGHVVDKSSHQPLTSFQAGINTSRSGGGMAFVMPPQLRNFTSDDGTFVLENVPPGQTQLVVHAGGYTAGRVPNLTVEDGKAIADVIVEMDTGVRLIGRITGPDGSPVNGASVRPDTGGGRGMRLPSMDLGATTDANGDYAIEAIDPGEKTFQINAPGLLPESKTITLSDKETRLDVRLSAGARVSGQVVTESGVPVSDAAVSARSASSVNFPFKNSLAR